MAIISGTNCNDTLTGVTSPVLPNDPGDEIHGLAGNDRITGLWGADRLFGENGNDLLSGGAGHDVLDGGAGNDRLFGESGNDIHTGGAGDDSLDGGVDIDTADHNTATAGVRVSLEITVRQNTGGAGRDTIVNVENLTGSNFNDILTGNSSDNFMIAGKGADILRGGNGNDTLLSQSNDGLKDTLDGGAGNDSLLSGNGNDKLVGGSGNDILNAWLGQDTLTGGTGADKFQFGSADESTVTTPDRITDFTVGEDRIVASFASVVSISGPVNAQTVLLDYNFDGITDSAIVVTANAALSASDFSTSIFGF